MCVYIGRAERRPLRRVVLLAALASADVFCYSSILRNLKYYFAARDAWRRAVEGERQCGVVSLVCGRSERKRLSTWRPLRSKLRLSSLQSSIITAPPTHLLQPHYPATMGVVASCCESCCRFSLSTASSACNNSSSPFTEVSVVRTPPA